MNLISWCCSTVALCKLLQHGLNTDDKRLQDIMVKGEEIYNPDDGIRTRSKSAKSKPPKLTGLMCLHSHQVTLIYFKNVLVLI